MIENPPRGGAPAAGAKHGAGAGGAFPARVFPAPAIWRIRIRCAAAGAAPRLPEGPLHRRSGGKKGRNLGKIKKFLFFIKIFAIESKTQIPERRWGG